MKTKILIFILISFLFCIYSYSQKNTASGNNFVSSNDIVEKIEKNKTVSYSEYLKLKKDKEVFSAVMVTIFAVFIFMFFIAGMRFKKINDALRKKNSKIGKQRIMIEEQKNRLREKTLDLMVLNKELKENSELREALTEMIVHDLKNPISNILNISEKKEVKWFARQMLMMVENILDVQKYEGMLMPLKLKPVHLVKAVNEAVSHISLFAEHKNIAVKKDIDFDVFVISDEDILTRVIINFLSNAVKYTLHNGEVKIEGKLQKENKVLIKITDNGIGMKEDEIPYIFDKFNQIIARKTGEARSTGIGLTFCKMAIDAHESEIIVKSKPGEFTSFEFYLKKADNAYIQDVSETVVNDIVVDLPELNNEEKKYLNNFYEKLKNKDVYEIGDIKIIIEQIDDKLSENIIEWKNKLNDSVFYCNNELFKKIVNQMNIKK